MTSKSNKDSNKKECHYHLCRKQTKLYKCKFCGRYFCKDHIKPKPPGLPRFKGTSHEDLVFMEEWHKPGGHPCIPYSDHWKANNQDILESDNRPKNDQELTRRKVSKPTKIGNYWYWNKNKVTKTIIAIIVLSLIGHFVFIGLQSGKIQSFLSDINNEDEELVIEQPDSNSVRETNMSIDINKLEKEVHERINDQRELNGLNKLKWNADIADIARKHSDYLASTNQISHKGKKGKYHDYRLKSGGIYYFGLSGENVAMTPKGNVMGCGYTDDLKGMAKCTVSSWMGSPGHRKNILTSEFDETGIGVATDNGEEYYFTQVFINHVECGYKTGSCCEESGFYPYCYEPLECISGTCL